MRLIKVVVALVAEQVCVYLDAPPPQVDLIDLQSCPDGHFKFLLDYQDHGGKLCDNRPLESKRFEAVALALMDITENRPCSGLFMIIPRQEYMLKTYPRYGGLILTTR
eukprot:5941990-Pleurochrysis_carterae.AAC.1